MISDFIDGGFGCTVFDFVVDGDGIQNCGHVQLLLLMRRENGFSWGCDS
jgi:hypothetical protein